MSKPKPAPLPSGTVVGGYQIVKKLAAGGFGVVYLAEGENQQLVADQGVPAFFAGRALPGRADAARQARQAAAVPPGPEELLRRRPFARADQPPERGVGAELLPRERNRLHGDELPAGRHPAGLHRHRARPEARQGVPRSTIRSLFDEILRGLRIVHQHKMLHLDIKPANVFITNDNKAVMLDFGAAREVLSKEGNFIRPMYTPGFAAPEMYRRDGTLGPWTDIYAIGACIYACMQGYPPNDAPQRLEKDRLALSLSRLRNVYSDNLIEVTEWCMSLDPLSRPQSVFALQKELSRETERRYTKLSFSERLKLQLETIKTGAKT
jgi:serine/threonine protein kinase